MDRRIWKLADEWRPSKLLHYWERPEYWEKFWRVEETCSHLNSCEIPSANTDVKNSLGEIIFAKFRRQNWKKKTNIFSLQKQKTIEINWVWFRRAINRYIINSSQNKVIISNYVWGRTDKIPENSNWKIYGERYSVVYVESSVWFLSLKSY